MRCFYCSTGARTVARAAALSSAQGQLHCAAEGSLQITSSAQNPRSSKRESCRSSKGETANVRAAETPVQPAAAFGFSRSGPQQQESATAVAQETGAAPASTTTLGNEATCTSYTLYAA